MTRFLAAALLALSLSPAAFARTLTPQQQKMKDCNAQAKSQHLKGKAREGFLSQCLGGGTTKVTKAPAKALTPQQRKMQTCNAQATEQHLKGAARKAFMSSCLKKK